MLKEKKASQRGGAFTRELSGTGRWAVLPFHIFCPKWDQFAGSALVWCWFLPFWRQA